MNQILNALPDRLEATETSLESALVAGGWEPHGGTAWCLSTPCGDALLEEIAHRDYWRQYYLSGGAVPKSKNSRVLYDNSGLSGPAKFIAQPGSCPACRLDVPEDLANSLADPFAFGAALPVVDAYAAWVQAVSGLALGCTSRQKSAPIADAAIAANLKQAGWSATVDNGRTVVHLQLPGVYRQLLLEHDHAAGIKLVVDLINLADLEDRCLEAMLLLAQEANARVPLVRMAILESGKQMVLRAEVSLGAPLIESSLLLYALHTLENTVALTARELEALRDADVASLVLSAATVRESISHP